MIQSPLENNPNVKFDLNHNKFKMKEDSKI